MFMHTIWYPWISGYLKSPLDCQTIHLVQIKYQDRLKFIISIISDMDSYTRCSGASEWVSGSDTLRIMKVRENFWYPKTQNENWYNFLVGFCDKFNTGKSTCFKVISQCFLEDNIYRFDTDFLKWKFRL